METPHAVLVRETQVHLVEAARGDGHKIPAYIVIEVEGDRDPALESGIRLEECIHLVHVPSQ
eukprot:CAMPEP_0115538410 /NCGR_PEP_ID=MMETSP0271-20121206/88866_1 /TAXON_ID=71861 /ORGANISM="Scrippsiella trochoidea, Strain CCMP3099" /LENGTH=61 /DNA_ID=CAMNT_0002971309 /DNA_START=1 /DNA_END=183 /DNA_ORIENTATION=-